MPHNFQGSSQGIQTVIPAIQAQQPIQQVFTPTRSTSRLAEALLRQGSQERVIETPLEALGQVSQSLAGAFLAKKAEKEEATARQQQQAARGEDISEFARILAQGGTPEQLPTGPLPEGVAGPTSPGREAIGLPQTLADFTGRAQTPEGQQLALSGLQKALAGEQQGPQFTNVQFDEAGNAIGINAQGQRQAIPDAPQGPGQQGLSGLQQALAGEQQQPGAPQVPGQQQPGTLGAFGARERQRAEEKRREEATKSSRDFTQSLRKEVGSTSKQFSEQEAANQRIKSVTRDKEGNLLQTPSASLALVFNFMKLLDPTSVVRESEFKTAEQARGWLTTMQESGQPVPTPVLQFIQGLAGEGRMTVDQINDFTARADDIFQGAQSVNARQIAPIIESARARGVPLARIMTKGQRSSFMSSLSDEELEAFTQEAQAGGVR